MQQIQMPFFIYLFSKQQNINERYKLEYGFNLTYLIVPLKSETFWMVTFVTSCSPSKSILLSMIGASGSVNWWDNQKFVELFSPLLQVYKMSLD